LSGSLALTSQSGSEEMKLNLEMQISTIQAGLYAVSYGSIKSPLNIQEAAFVANSLELVSPAQLGFLRTQEGKGAFNEFSRTSADVFYDDRASQKVVIVPNRVISRLIGSNNLVAAHAQNKEYIISKPQRELVYGVVDEMLIKGIAFVAEHGESVVSTSNFGQTELAYNLFSDERLGIKAQDYGDWLKTKEGRKEAIFLFSDKDYSKSKKGPYLNRLRLFGHVRDFDAGSLGLNLDFPCGSFGARFDEIAEVGAKNNIKP